MDRVRKLKHVLWALTGLAFAVGVTRFVFGLGVTTNLTDAVPWGLWIGFDVMSGVALAAGGFVVTALVYIFGREEFHPIVRPAVLTAFLGYVAVIFGLMFDLGLPWNIWHMIVFWNPHSALFEVGWCVMLYTTVLLLEFSPVPMESSSAWSRIRSTLVKSRIPLVVTGIALSTLHQSSLGTLFMIMPYRVPPLWYTPILPILFFLSAIGLGMMMVIFESHFTSYFYRRKPEVELLSKIGGWARWVLLLYLVVRFSDILLRGQSAALIASGWRTVWFWLEIALIVGIPILFFSFPKARATRTGQWTAATLGVTGIVLNRINVGGFVHLDRSTGIYLPSLNELAISAGVVAILALLFLTILERFHVWESRPVDPHAKPSAVPEFDSASRASLGTPILSSGYTNSLLFVFTAALGFAFLSSNTVHSEGCSRQAVQAARGGDSLWVDGDRDGDGVLFAHEAHKRRIQEITPAELSGAAVSPLPTVTVLASPGTRQSAVCAQCHHMNLPGDQASLCSECHRDMFVTTDAFGHSWHSDPEGGNLSCVSCHAKGATKLTSTARRCDECHKDLIPAGATRAVQTYLAPGYVEAMHELCRTCHLEQAVVLARPELGQCAACHKTGKFEVVNLTPFDKSTVTELRK